VRKIDDWSRQPAAGDLPGEKAVPPQYIGEALITRFHIESRRGKLVGDHIQHLSRERRCSTCGAGRWHGSAA
jgi:hypothetical protein